jgi:hypothetical protein
VWSASGPADFVVTKILAGRAKDIEDARGVLQERGARWQADQIRATLTLLEAALGLSDLLRLFEAELACTHASNR